MKKTFLLVILITFLANFSLQSFAYENKTPNYLIEENYKKDFILESNQINNQVYDLTVNLKNQEIESVSPNLWIASVFYPGLGQFIMGDIFWGFFYSIISSLIIVPSFILISTKTMLGYFTGGIFLILFACFFYPFNIINAQEINKEKVKMSEGSLSELNNRQKSLKQIADNLVMKEQSLVYNIQF